MTCKWSMNQAKTCSLQALLSRAPEVSNETTANKNDEFEVLTLENLPVSEVKLEQFKD